MNNKKKNGFWKMICSIIIWAVARVMQYCFFMCFTYYVIWDLAQNTNSEYLLGSKVTEDTLEQKFELEREMGCKYRTKRYLLEKYEKDGRYITYHQYVRVKRYPNAEKSPFRVVSTYEKNINVYGIQEGTELKKASEILYQKGYIKKKNSYREYFQKGGVLIELYIVDEKVKEIEPKLYRPNFIMIQQCSSFQYGCYRVIRWLIAVWEAYLLN